jgi:hypothetical protein
MLDTSGNNLLLNRKDSERVLELYILLRKLLRQTHQLVCSNTNWWIMWGC